MLFQPYIDEIITSQPVHPIHLTFSTIPQRYLQLEFHTFCVTFNL